MSGTIDPAVTEPPWGSWKILMRLSAAAVATKTLISARIRTVLNLVFTFNFLPSASITWFRFDGSTMLNRPLS